jgi:GntR family transcriptional regulator
VPVLDAFVTVDVALETPPYQQIVEQVRAAIERRDLEPGDGLPTVRQLAGDLALAPNTVARAYAGLAGLGFIVSDGRRGTRVAPTVPASNNRARARTLREAITNFVSSLQHRGYSPDEIETELRRAAPGRG